MSGAATKRPQTAVRTERELEDAVRELTALGASLTRSYQALELRAKHVEDELADANRELARKVGQLDAVTAELEAVLDALPTGVVVRDDAGRIVRVNDAALEVLGRTRDELSGFAGQLVGGAEHGGDEWSERDFAREDGRRVVIARRRSAITTAHGNSGRARSVEILDDRTAMVEMAERLHALDKLAALGNMAGGIAHELRNPMMAIKGFAALLAGKLPAGGDHRRWADLIVEGVDECNSILTSMMSLASPEKLVLETVEPFALVNDALQMAARDAGVDANSSAWRLETSIDAPCFAGDRIKLRQALRNLIANALQAQGSAGSLRVELALRGEEIVLTSSDAGPGIPRGLMRRVLEPFFTTRAEGTGLGLALVQRIAELHGGRVDIVPVSGPLGGACVALRIPFRSPQS